VSGSRPEFLSGLCGKRHDVSTFENMVCRDAPFHVRHVRVSSVDGKIGRAVSTEHDSVLDDQCGYQPCVAVANSGSFGAPKYVARLGLESDKVAFVLEEQLPVTYDQCQREDIRDFTVVLLPDEFA